MKDRFRCSGTLQSKSEGKVTKVIKCFNFAMELTMLWNMDVQKQSIAAISRLSLSAFSFDRVQKTFTRPSGYDLFYNLQPLSLRQYRKHIATPLLLSCLMFRLAPCFNITNSVHYSQDPSCYVHRVELTPFPTYFFDKKCFLLRRFSKSRYFV